MAKRIPCIFLALALLTVYASTSAYAAERDPGVKRDPGGSAPSISPLPRGRTVTSQCLECGVLEPVDDYGDAGSRACTRLGCYECAWVMKLGREMCTRVTRTAKCSCSDGGSDCTNKGVCTIG
jgi:hypothetical protein